MRTASLQIGETGLRKDVYVQSCVSIFMLRPKIIEHFAHPHAELDAADAIQVLPCEEALREHLQHGVRPISDGMFEFYDVRVADICQLRQGKSITRPCGCATSLGFAFAPGCAVLL